LQVPVQKFRHVLKVSAAQELISIPQKEFVDKVVEREGDIPQVQSIDELADVSTQKQVQVPMGGKVLKEGKTPQVEFVEQDAQVPVQRRRCGPIAPVAQKLVDIPQMELVDKVAQVPVQKMVRFADIPQVELGDQAAQVPVQKHMMSVDIQQAEIVDKAVELFDQVSNIVELPDRHQMSSAKEEVDDASSAIVDYGKVLQLFVYQYWSIYEQMTTAEGEQLNLDATSATGGEEYYKLLFKYQTGADRHKDPHKFMRCKGNMESGIMLEALQHKDAQFLSAFLTKNAIRRPTSRRCRTRSRERSTTFSWSASETA